MIARPLSGTQLGTPDNTFVVVEWSDHRESGRDRPVAPLHRHLTEDEAWVVLDGSLGFVVGDDEVEAGAGDAVLVPRGTPHTYWNAGDELARYVLVMGPRTAALVEALHQPGWEPSQLPSLFRAHDAELLA